MARYNNLGSPPTELLVQLPIAIHKAGTLLTNNLLNVSPPAELFVIHPINQDFFDLTAAVKYLKNFAFLLDCQSYSDHWGPLSAKDFKLLGQVLAAFTNTTTLEDSKLSLNGLWDDERPPAASLGSIINVRSYPNLRHVDWSGLSIHLSELEHGIQLLRERSPISALTTRTCGQGPGLRP
ncbi:uncharacterized protein LY89DRAFT_690163 [Mollisia scopiformis]|uniref:Uncharacterized protein n=1 Tax=Mollisia scopiformis TaxID=149040 RepID=A0A132BCM3_MOLSC|nr:uncharacterized protein LY89DRAFT_690163 [Mollisia scopiformis]KUJ09749.1 hypothetical protein LY89DRAFT_690163 [Mollisia scopiformis]